MVMSSKNRQADYLVRAARAATVRHGGQQLVYANSSGTPGYGVSLPPGRAYASGKSLHDPNYPNDILARNGYSRIDREIERREDRRREILHERERFLAGYDCAPLPFS
ncbi:hypothetical protein L1887_09178 [Cichorium endivia]|nr:hypothetical protein L1887_09178 [Cichorium endivia]